MYPTAVQESFIEYGLNVLLRYRDCTYFQQAGKGGRAEALRRCHKMMLESTTWGVGAVHEVWTRAIQYGLIKPCDYERSKEQ